MAITDTDIANMALALVKEEPLTDFTDKTKSKIIVQSVFGIVRKECFELPENWHFATSRAQLTELSVGGSIVTPAFGWDHQYQFPDNHLRTLATVDERGDDIQYKWDREVYVKGSTQIDVLLSNETTCFIRFLVLRTNPNAYPGWFVKLFYHEIALRISGPLTKDDQKYNQIAIMRDRAYAEAKAANGKDIARVNEFGENLDEGHDMRQEVIGLANDYVIERA